MSGVDEALVTDAVVALLRAQLPDVVKVGDGGAPYVDASEHPLGYVDPTTGESTPWLVVYCIPPATGLAPGYVGQDGTEVVRFQLTASGSDRPSAHGLAVVATGLLVDREDDAPRDYVMPLTVAGHAVMARRKVDRIPATEEGGWWNAGALVDVWVHRDA